MNGALKNVEWPSQEKPSPEGNIYKNELEQTKNNTYK